MGVKFNPLTGNFDLVNSPQGTNLGDLIILTKSSSVNQNVGGSNGTEVFWTWDGETRKDGNYLHDNSTNPERVEVATDGWYNVRFIGGAQTTGSARTTLQGIFRINGGSTRRDGSLRNYTRGQAYGNITTGLVLTIELSAGDYIEFGTRVEDSDGAYTINTSGGEISDDCHQLVIERVSDAGQNTGDVNLVQPFTSQSSVTVTHNLGKKPSVTVLDTTGDEVEGEINHVSTNELTIDFSSSFSGSVILN